MNDWMNNELVPVADTFDQDFGNRNEIMNFDNHQELIQVNYDRYDYSNEFLDYQDPLKHAYKCKFQPFHLDLGNIHFVQPHHVDGYFRQDGTYVEGYYRDGDGNTNLNRPLEAGGGYVRSNPDGNPFNNL
ncbi:hypothetical protein [Mesobacillus jeotgali]|uniref:hypothetical protein n=1 Tax=Mesobacillus jeotgali TaxID=129985 RepID=UPI00177A8CDC|nr:hypothetical protein [Mesobacillus jeotgali]UYZ21764.1 hypothetical protein FOF60_22660 [Mesobacillus jeotgali]